ncbi:MAG: hypothetical protein ACFCU6_11020 [Balneolaceae bacterium]
MTGYTEVLQVIGATIIFSLILTTANRFMLSNTQRQVGTEVEISAVTLAQDLIEDAKLRAFDQATEGGEIPINIPGDFTAAPFAQTTASSRDMITNFEGFNGFTETIDTGLGTYTLTAQVEYVEPGNLNQVTNSKTRYKRLIVTITNPSLNSPISIQYTRTYN